MDKNIEKIEQHILLFNIVNDFLYKPHLKINKNKFKNIFNNNNSYNLFRSFILIIIYYYI